MESNYFDKILYLGLRSHAWFLVKIFMLELILRSVAYSSISLMFKFLFGSMRRR